MNIDEAERKYMTDPDFHTLVEQNYNLLHDLRFTPSDLRDAAMLAAIRFEQRRVRPMLHGRSGRWIR